jgi:hypothetical protein
MDTAKTSPAAAGGSLCGAGVHLVAVAVCEDSLTRPAPARRLTPPG